MLNHEVNIRPFRPADLQDVISLWDVTIADPQPCNEPRSAIVHKLLQQDGLFLVADVQGRIAGAIQGGYDGVRGWIYKLAVDPDHQRTGVGRRLLNDMERQLTARGCRKIKLQVRTSNSQVSAFYESCGYTREQVVSFGKSLVDEERPVEPPPTLPLGQGLSLTPFLSTDGPALLEHLNVSDVWKRNTTGIPFPYTELDAELFLEQARLETVQHDRCRNWAIRQGDRLIGGMGLRELRVGEKAELGYWLAMGWWGRGIVTLAARTLCEDAFHRYELRKICAGAWSMNPASCRVLEKAGFEKEAVLRAHAYRDGRVLDEVRYGRWRDE